MKNIQLLKAYLKDTAAQIKESTKQLKKYQKEEQYTIYSGLQRRIPILQYDYRHHHIAYCELRGIPRDRIEKPKDKHLPNESYIAQIKEKYAWTPEEIEVYNERRARHEKAICVN